MKTRFIFVQCQASLLSKSQEKKDGPFHFGRIKCSVLGDDVNNTKLQSSLLLGSSVTPTPTPQDIFVVYFLTKENRFKKIYLHIKTILDCNMNKKFILQDSSNSEINK